jgi:hypothetical protein
VTSFLSFLANTYDYLWTPPSIKAHRPGDTQRQTQHNREDRLAALHVGEVAELGLGVDIKKAGQHQRFKDHEDAHGAHRRGQIRRCQGGWRQAGDTGFIGSVRHPRAQRGNPVLHHIGKIGAVLDCRASLAMTMGLGEATPPIHPPFISPTSDEPLFFVGEALK